MVDVRNEDPTFETDFDRWTHAGAPAELVALVSPLLRGNELGGSAQARRDAEAFLHQQSLGGLMREPFDNASAHNEGLALLGRHGRKIDGDVMRRYAPDDAAIEGVLDQQHPMPGSEPEPLTVRDTRPVREAEDTAPVTTNWSTWRRPSDAELGIEKASETDAVSYSDTGPVPFWEA